MASEDPARKIESYISKLSGEESFLGKIRSESDRHREEHSCDVYPSDPLTGRLLDVLVRATSPRRVLEVGCGLGYSAIWLARAAPLGARVDTIEQDPQHAGLAKNNFKAARVEGRVRILTGRQVQSSPN